MEWKCRNKAQEKHRVYKPHSSFGKKDSVWSNITQRINKSIGNRISGPPADKWRKQINKNKLIRPVGKFHSNLFYKTHVNSVNQTSPRQRCGKIIQLEKRKSGEFRKCSAAEESRRLTDTSGSEPARAEPAGWNWGRKNSDQSELYILMTSPVPKRNRLSQVIDRKATSAPGKWRQCLCPKPLTRSLLPAPYRGSHCKEDETVSSLGKGKTAFGPSRWK